MYSFAMFCVYKIKFYTGISYAEIIMHLKEMEFIDNETATDIYNNSLERIVNV